MAADTATLGYRLNAEPAKSVRMLPDMGGLGAVSDHPVHPPALLTGMVPYQGSSSLRASPAASSSVR